MPWFGVIVDGDSKPESIARYKQKGFEPSAGFGPSTGLGQSIGVVLN